uniref:Uncharacterized protein n=1 Tax=Anguilla anguilla TaxID=7936 RepID=A0A0E9X1P6_ANGAN
MRHSTAGVKTMKYPDVSCSSEIRQPGKRGWWTCVCYVSPTSLAACSLTSKEEKQEVVRSAPTILQAGHSIYHRKSFFSTRFQFCSKAKSLL